MPTLEKSDIELLKRLSETCEVKKNGNALACDALFVLECYPEIAPEECVFKVKDVKAVVYYDTSSKRYHGYYEPFYTPLQNPEFFLQGFKEVYAKLLSRYVPPPEPVVTPPTPQVETTKPKTIDEILDALEAFAQGKYVPKIDKEEKEFPECASLKYIVREQEYVASLLKAMKEKRKEDAIRYYNWIAMNATTEKNSALISALDGCLKEIEKIKSL